jgi:hypothetical protein
MVGMDVTHDDDALPNKRFDRPDDEQREHRSLCHATRRGSSPLKGQNGRLSSPAIFPGGST